MNGVRRAIGIAVVVLVALGFGPAPGIASQEGGGEAAQATTGTGPTGGAAGTATLADRGFTVASPFATEEETETLLTRMVQQLSIFLDYSELRPAGTGTPVRSGATGQRARVAAPVAIGLGGMPPVADAPPGIPRASAVPAALAGLDGSCRMRTVAGLSGGRCLGALGPDGSPRALEIAMLPSPNGGIDIMVHGLELGPDGRVANPDVERARAMLEELVEVAKSPPAQPDPEELAHYMYTLSFMQADRALALLKTLGYATVEYERDSGENDQSSIYRPITAEAYDLLAETGQQMAPRPLPMIVKIIDSPSTALETDPTSVGGSGNANLITLLGHDLENLTTSEPQQRLMIIYDPADMTPLENLLNLLREEIDVPSKQVVIEALVVELSTDSRRELGIDFTLDSGDVASGVNFGGGVSQFTFDNEGNFDGTRFKLDLAALLDTGSADLLANPSVLVLDGRQAKIQIGRRIPVVSTNFNADGFASLDVEYFPIGILLNMRPKVSEDSDEISLQVEANVSAVGAEVVQTDDEGRVRFSAPVVESRLIESFVRLANDTPFIIGGLIQDEETSRETGVPLLKEIPLLGNLFKRTVNTSIKREVIIVLTPHVVPVEEATFRYLLPKDSDVFDSEGLDLFRNAYRVRVDDVFDWSFIYEAEALQELRATTQLLYDRGDFSRQMTSGHPDEPLLNHIMDGGIPGEEMLVARELWEIVHRIGYGKYIDLDKVIVFEEAEDDPDGFETETVQELLDRMPGGMNALALEFDTAEHVSEEFPIGQPLTVPEFFNVAPDQYDEKLRSLNIRDRGQEPLLWSILLHNEQVPELNSDAHDTMEFLREVLVVERVLELNPSVDMTLKHLQPGRQLIFPSIESLQSRRHMLDRRAAELFYEVAHYWSEFEHEFVRAQNHVEALVNGH